MNAPKLRASWFFFWLNAGMGAFLLATVFFDASPVVWWLGRAWIVVAYCEVLCRRAMDVIDMRDER